MISMKLFERILSGAAYPLFALALLAPACTLPVAAEQPFKTAQEVVAVAFCWAFLALVATLRLWRGRSPFPAFNSSARVAIGGVVLWFAVSTVFSYNPAISVGYLVSVIAYAGMAIATLGWLEDAPGRRNFVIGLFACELGLQSLASLLEITRAPILQAALDAVPLYVVAGHQVPGNLWLHDFLTALVMISRGGILVGTLGNPNYVAELFTLLLPVLVGWAFGLSTGRSRILAAVGMLPLLVVYGLTDCRAALLGVVVGGIVAAGIVYGAQRFNPLIAWQSRAQRPLVAAAATALVLLAGVAARGVVTKFHGGIDVDITRRLLNWRSTINLACHHLLTGVGLGAFKLTNVQQLAADNPNGLPYGASLERFVQAHSEPIQAFAEFGVIGVAVLGLAFGLWGREVRNNQDLAQGQKFGLLWGMSGLLVASCFGFPFHIPQTAMSVMMVVAMGLARGADSPSEARTAWNPLLALVAGALVALIGTQTYLKYTWPSYVGQEYAYVGIKLADEKMFNQAEKVFAVATRLVRFKGWYGLFLVRSYVEDHRYQEALMQYQAERRDGLGMEAEYWRGLALACLGRPQEALGAYEKVLHYYDKDNVYFGKAQEGVRLLQKDVALSPSR